MSVIPLSIIDSRGPVDLDSPTLVTETVTAGLLCRGAFRSQLERARFLGRQVEWHEDRGWLGSEFTVRANRRTLLALIDWVDQMTGEDVS